MKLTLLVSPPSLKSGSDVIGHRTARAFSELGLECQCVYVWPELAARLTMTSGLPLGGHIYRLFISPLSLARFWNRFGAGDIVWMFDVSLFGFQKNTAFERRLRSRGAKYVFNLHDDWLSIPGYDEAARSRIKLANLVAAITPGIAERVAAEFPEAPLALLEAPIDIDRVKPVPPHVSSDLPFIVWTGNPRNLKELPNAYEVLARVHAHKPFRLRIISGHKRPELNLPVPWEWFPYDLQQESNQLSGAAAGLAPLIDTPYARCKDMYKIKTYMAAGIPTVASPVGNNPRVLRHGHAGFFATTAEEWEQALSRLIGDPDCARQMGQQARADCVDRFSHHNLIPKWLDIMCRYFPELERLK